MEPCTRHIVFLIDLHFLFCSSSSTQNPNANPNSYSTQVLSSIRKILAAPQLASSLSSFKFFFSSLSPYLSSSKTHRILGKSPDKLSFHRHSQTLISLQETLNSVLLNIDLCNERIDGVPKASLLAESVLLLGQCVCDRDISDVVDKDLVKFRSNLVVLFSPVSRYANTLAQFLDLEVIGDDSISFDVFSKKFSRIFGRVKERLDSWDIHLTWVGVDSEFGYENEITNSDWIEKVFKKSNWGYSSTDKIILGSSIVPIGLIFPYIGTSIGQLTSTNLKKIQQIDFILEISDVSGNPLECKSCDLELLNFKILNQRSAKTYPQFHNSIHEISKIHVKGVNSTENISNLIQNSLSVLLIHGISREIVQNSEQISKDSLFPDKILELLCTEMGELVPGKPIWQLFLSFLHSKNYSAFISIPDLNGTIYEGILVPCTINHALVYILEKGLLIEIKEEKKKKKKGKENLIEFDDLNSFRQIVLSNSEPGILMDLHNFYLRNLSPKQKKLKFFKCWMSQVRQFGIGIRNVLVPEPEKEKEIQEIQVDNEIDSQFGSIEEIDEFIGGLEEKIERALIAEQCNLAILAESLVQISMQAISQKNMGENIENISLEVSKLLFKKPKDLIAKYKDGNYDKIYKFKEREVQILFRMEILKSELGSKIEDNSKQKMVKEICSFLESIDLSLDMDSSRFTPTNLLQFVEKSLKSRYNDTLPKIIQKIYAEMELDISEEDENVYVSNTDPDNSSNCANKVFDKMLEKEFVEAQKNRDRDRRFQSSTSFAPDLRRVWAIKRPKLDQLGPNSRAHKLGKKKKRRVSSDIVVSETPMKEKYCGTGTKEISVCRSLNKVFFED